MKWRFTLLVGLCSISTVSAQMQWESADPRPNAQSIDRAALITLEFDRNVDLTTFAPPDARVVGNHTGLVEGSFFVGFNPSFVFFEPDEPVFAGEVVRVYLTQNLQSSNGVPLAAARRWEYRAAAEPQDTTWDKGRPQRRVIDNNARSAENVFAADMDGDGDIDVLSASSLDNTIAWYENQGATNWTKRIISQNAQGARSVVAADIDQDGDMDALSASQRDNKVAWYENQNGNWQETVLTTQAGRATSVYAADMDGDGDNDILYTSLDDNTVAWFENLGGNNWQENIIFEDLREGPIAAYPADLDGDGDPDVAVAAFDENALLWYENQGNGSWPERIVDDNINDAISPYAADLDQDGDLDLVAGARSDDEVLWYENTQRASWPKRVVNQRADAVRSVRVADMDGDGDPDILSASRFSEEIAWYENGANWRKFVITRRARGATSVFAADIDGDGDMDAMSASFADNTVAWYELLPAQDTVPPVIQTRPAVAYLDASGRASISTQALDDSTYDSFSGLDTLYLSRYDFDCSDLGEQEITFVAVDSVDNRDSVVVRVEVLDTLGPSVPSGDTTLFLNSQGEASLLDFATDGVTDNCTVDSIGLSRNLFDCSDRGTQADVSILALDGAGNQTASPLRLTILDTTPPLVRLPKDTAFCRQGSDRRFAYEYSTEDNCGLADASIQGPASESTFNFGQNVVVALAEDSSGNIGRDTMRVTLNQPPEARFDFDTTGLELRVRALDERAAEVRWQWGDGERDVFAEGTHRYEEAGRYDLLMTAVGADGCEDTSHFRLTLTQPEGYCRIPNAFTPDGNQVNDSWQPICEDVSSVQWTIYDRWGQQQRRVRGLEKAWHGLNTEGKPLPTGAYLYELCFVAEDELGRQQPRKCVQGTVELLR